jgi:hypothetical protein
VYIAFDGGVVNEQWQRLGAHLPDVPVTQIQRARARKLVAATFGRGVWTLDVRGAVASIEGISISPASVVSGSSATGTVTLSAPAWARTRVGLNAVETGHGQFGPASTAAHVQSEVFVEAGNSQATFPITTTGSTSSAPRSATIYATAGGTQWARLRVT